MDKFKKSGLDAKHSCIHRVFLPFIYVRMFVDRFKTLSNIIFSS